jgi:hypothetical protein
VVSTVRPEGNPDSKKLDCVEDEESFCSLGTKVSCALAKLNYKLHSVPDNMLVI